MSPAWQAFPKWSAVRSFLDFWPREICSKSRNFFSSPSTPHQSTPVFLRSPQVSLCSSPRAETRAAQATFNGLQSVLTINCFSIDESQDMKAMSCPKDCRNLEHRIPRAFLQNFPSGSKPRRRKFEEKIPWILGIGGSLWLCAHTSRAEFIRPMNNHASVMAKIIGTIGPFSPSAPPNTKWSGRGRERMFILVPQERHTWISGTHFVC